MLNTTDTWLLGCVFLEAVTYLIEQHLAPYSSLESWLLGANKDNNVYETKRRSVLPVDANKIPLFALPDTGVNGNVMTEEQARSLGVSVDRNPKKRYRFENAVKTSFQSVGSATLDLSLQGDPSRIWKCDFAIVKRCAAPMVLGKAFLDEAEIFTTFRHHLVKARLDVTRSSKGHAKRTWRLLLMDPSRQKLKCLVGGVPVLADADSGAEIDVVSLHYARMRMWDINPLPLDEGFVILANNDVVKLSGYIDTYLTIQGKSAGRRLYVLDGLENNVVLGDETIEEFKVFELDDVFVKIGDYAVYEAFCLIQWVERYDQLESDVDHILGQNSAVRAKKRNWLSFMRKASRSSPEVVKLALRNRLDLLDTAEADYEDHAERRLAGLSRRALAQERDDNWRRRDKHEHLRVKILSEIARLEQL